MNMKTIVVDLNQKCLLKEVFKVIPYPNHYPDSLNRLAGDTGLDQEVIKQWFKDRRKRMGHKYAILENDDQEDLVVIPSNELSDNVSKGEKEPVEDVNHASPENANDNSFATEEPSAGNVPALNEENKLPESIMEVDSEHVVKRNTGDTISNDNDDIDHEVNKDSSSSTSSENQIMSLENDEKNNCESGFIDKVSDVENKKNEEMMIEREHGKNLSKENEEQGKQSDKIENKQDEMPATLEKVNEKLSSEQEENFGKTSNSSKVQKKFGNTSVNSQIIDDVVNNVSLDKVTESPNIKESCSEKNYCQADVINETEMIKQKENLKDRESYLDMEHGKNQTLDQDNDSDIDLGIPKKGMEKLIINEEKQEVTSDIGTRENEILMKKEEVKEMSIYEKAANLVVLQKEFLDLQKKFASLSQIVKSSGVDKGTSPVTMVASKSEKTPTTEEPHTFPVQKPDAFLCNTELVVKEEPPSNRSDSYYQPYSQLPARYPLYHNQMYSTNCSYPYFPATYNLPYPPIDYPIYPIQSISQRSVNHANQITTPFIEPVKLNALKRKSPSPKLLPEVSQGPSQSKFPRFQDKNLPSSISTPTVHPVGNEVSDGNDSIVTSHEAPKFKPKPCPLPSVTRKKPITKHEKSTPVPLSRTAPKQAEYLSRGPMKLVQHPAQVAQRTFQYPPSSASTTEKLPRSPLGIKKDAMSKSKNVVSSPKTRNYLSNAVQRLPHTQSQTTPSPSHIRQHLKAETLPSLVKQSKGFPSSARRKSVKMGAQPKPLPKSIPIHEKNLMAINPLRIHEENLMAINPFRQVKKNGSQMQVSPTLRPTETFKHKMQGLEMDQSRFVPGPMFPHLGNGVTVQKISNQPGVSREMHKYVMTSNLSKKVN